MEDQTSIPVDDAVPTVPAKIAEALLQHAIEIDELTTHPRNPRRGDVTAIAESLERFGQVRPIVVQASTGHIIAGNHTWKAAKSLGWDKIAAIFARVEEDEALAYVLADNRTADLGDYDLEVLAPLLEMMMATGKLAGTGYSPDDVEDLMSALDALPEVDVDTEADYAENAEETAARFKPQEATVEQAQVVLLYPKDQIEDIRGMILQLMDAWGVSGAREVVAEALRRAVATEEQV